MRDGLGKVAVYKDDQGVLHRRSASCTHLGCIVHWNSLEKCWDCPCHGSHFSPRGDVLNGPAVAPLAAAR
jgi:Rieske Fe-S protein